MSSSVPEDTIDTTERKSHSLPDFSTVVTPKLDSKPVTKCCTIALAESDTHGIADSVADSGSERGAFVCSDIAAISRANVATDSLAKPRV